MSSAFTIPELNEMIAALKTAYRNAAASGGVTTYTIKSGQGETTVRQASLSEISAQLQHYSSLLNEAIEIATGSNFTILTDSGNYYDKHF